MTSCASFSKRNLDFPIPPATLAVCAEEEPVEIEPGKKTVEQAAELVLSLRLSELDKSRCAKGWAWWYETLSGVKRKD